MSDQAEPMSHARRVQVIIECSAVTLSRIRLLEDDLNELAGGLRFLADQATERNLDAVAERLNAAVDAINTVLWDTASAVRELVAKSAITITPEVVL